MTNTDKREMGRRVILLLALILVLSVPVAVPAAAAPGDVLTWGDNSGLQLGNGGVGEYSTSPAVVASLGDVRAVRGGCSHGLALRQDGTVWTWGDNSHGQLGNGTAGGSAGATPAQVGGLSEVKAIAAGCYHSLALKEDGTVWAWGENSEGQLGDGTDEDRNAPVPVGNLNGVKAIAAGGYHSLAAKVDGTVWAWGNNTFGQLGDGSNDQSFTPTQVQVRVLLNLKPLTNVRSIAAGDVFSMALKEDGTVLSWGENFYGQLGDGTNDNRYSAVSVKTPTGGVLRGVKAIAAGYYHALALKRDGTLRAWGDNADGQLGDGTFHDRKVAVRVRTGSGKTFGGVRRLAAGGEHSLALMKDATVRAWGYNSYGQLGDGTTKNRKRPARVKTSNGSPLAGIKAVAGGDEFSVALKN